MAWRSIVFMQNPEPGTPAAEWLSDAWQGDDDTLVNYLAEFDQEGCGDVTESPPWGTSDGVFSHGRYIVSYNRALDYIALSERVSE